MRYFIPVETAAGIRTIEGILKHSPVAGISGGLTSEGEGQYNVTERESEYGEGPERGTVRTAGQPGVAGAGVSEQSGSGEAGGLPEDGSSGLGDNFQSVGTVATGTFRVPFVKFSGPLGVDFLPSVAKVTQANIGDRAQEQLIALVFDKSNNLIHVHRHSGGGIASSLAHAGVLAGRALNTPGAASMILVHNHPSGVSDLSDSADLVVNKAIESDLRDSSVNYLGIMAVGGNTYSHAGATGTKRTDRGKIPAQLGKAVDKWKTVPMEERVIRRWSQQEHGLNDPEAVRAFGEKNLPKGGLIFLDAKRRPTAIYHIHPADMGVLRRGKQHVALLRAIEKTNAVGMFAFANSDKLPPNKTIENLAIFAASAGWMW
jgi:hypothetical protein